MRFTEALVLVSLMPAACNTGDSASGDLAMLDETVFRCAVEPVLIRECGYTACHGNPDFPLRVYSIGKLRAGDMRTLEERVQPLTEDERHANFLAAVGFTFGGVAPEDNLLLRKPMPSRNGGYEHVGRAIFTGPDDPRAVAIRDWLGGASSPCMNGGAKR